MVQEWVVIFVLKFSSQLMSGYKPRIRAHPKVNSRAAPSVETHHCVHGLDSGRNSGGRRTIKKTREVSHEKCSTFTNSTPTLALQILWWEVFRVVGKKSHFRVMFLVEI